MSGTADQRPNESLLHGLFRRFKIRIVKKLLTKCLLSYLKDENYALD